ncbi:hypothetical protein LTR70_010230, partial [Exophiala xenobiotica]
ADGRSSRPAHKERLLSESSITGAEGTSRKQLEIIRRYDHLVEDLRTRLNGDDRRAVAVALASLRQVVPSVPESDEIPDQTGESPTGDNPSPAHDDLAAPARRYLGEASEIRFLNSMKLALSGNIGSSQGLPPTHSEVWESYEQDEVSRHSGYEQEKFSLPPKATADKYLEIYFSTIHIAYPFVCQQTFLEKYEVFWETEAPYKLHGPWLSLLCG